MELGLEEDCPGRMKHFMELGAATLLGRAMTSLSREGEYSQRPSGRVGKAAFRRGGLRVAG
jgi:hypothetical protein